MSAPFYNAIKGTTAGAAGTGAFTPNAASSGYRAWSTVPTGWMGLVRYDDAGGAWELTYSYWNGTTLSRASTQLYDSSTGSAISLTAAATAAMVVDGIQVMENIGSTSIAMWNSQPGQTSASSLGIGSVPAVGTLGASSFANTNALTRQRRVQIASATTINSQAGIASIVPNAVVSTTAGQGGFEFIARLGASGLPTGPRLMCGMISSTFATSTQEPSALIAHIAAFGFDSTDTNIQLLTNSNAGACTKVDTGIPFVANGWYEFRIWTDPGSNKVWGLLMRLDTGAIWLGSTTTDVPADGALLFPQILGGLNGTNAGTAFTMQFGSVSIRNGY